MRVIQAPWTAEDGEIIDAKRKTVADYYGGVGPLLAASPDMLEALKTTLGNLLSLRHTAFNGVATIDEWIAVVEAAICRAEGRS